MQLLKRVILLRNLPCSTSSLLTVETDRIYVALNTSGVTRTIALDILNVFRQDRAYCWSSSQN